MLCPSHFGSSSRSVCLPVLRFQATRRLRMRDADPLLYGCMVLLDLGINWYRSAGNLQSGVVVFHLGETVIKGTTMLLVLRGKRWANYVQLLLSTLAFVSGMALLTQANRRAANDPLVWISLGAQVAAGVYCALQLRRAA